MYQPTDLKKGVVCQIDGKPFRVIEYGQKVMGRGGSIVNVRLKNLIDGSFIYGFRDLYCASVCRILKF